MLLLAAKTADTKTERRKKLKILVTLADNWLCTKPVTRLGCNWQHCLIAPDGTAIMVTPIHVFIKGKLTPVYQW